MFQFRFRRAAAAALLQLVCAAAGAESVTRETLAAWLAETTYANPPAAGTVVDAASLDTIKAYLPPGYLAEYEFPEVALEIQATVSYPPHEAYRAATEKFQGQATLGAGGELENYVAGRPFSDEQIAGATPEQAGYMIGWNNIQRWQSYGYQVDNLTMAYLKPGGDGKPPAPELGLEGGGHMERMVAQKYHRVYLNRLAMLGETDYRLDVPDGENRLFKDYIAFTEPFNVAGTKFVVERSLDPREDDQVNTYLPSERRVRRYSAKERADSFMGSDVTMDDFDGFAGRVLDYTWTYLGRKRLLDVIDTKHPGMRLYGPYSRAVNDRWQVRDCHVVELRSTWAEHPYGSRLLFIDAETYDVSVALAFNREGELWKIFDPVYRAPRSQTDLETSVASWRGQVNIDRLNNTATVVRARTDTLHPSVSATEVKRLFSVSALTSGK